MTSLLLAVQAFEVLLDEPGKIRTFPFTLDRPAYVEAVTYFPPIPISLAFKDATGATLERPPHVVWPAGDYVLEVSSPGSSPDPILVSVLLSDPLDPYEPNDTPETAAPLELPIGIRVRMFGGLDRDCFRFRVPRAGILGIQVGPIDAESESHFMLIEAAGTVIYMTQDRWSHCGMRYVAVEPGEYVLEVSDRAMADGFLSVRVGLYGRRADEGRGRFVGIGIGADSPQYHELWLVGEASGAPLRDTLTAEEIEREAREAIAARATAAAPEPSGSPWGWIAVGIAAAAGAAGAWAWRRRKAAQSAG